MQENKAVKSCLHPLEGAQETWHILPNPLCPLQKYGVAEGRPLADLKAMAKDAGEQCPSFTPSGGETLDEVWYLFIYLFICALLSRLFYQCSCSYWELPTESSVQPGIFSKLKNTAWSGNSGCQVGNLFIAKILILRLTPHEALAHRRVIAIALWRAEEFAQQSVTYIGFWALSVRNLCLLTEVVTCQVSERQNLCLLHSDLFILHNIPFWPFPAGERACEGFFWIPVPAGCWVGAEGAQQAWCTRQELRNIWRTVCFPLDKPLQWGRAELWGRWIFHDIRCQYFGGESWSLHEELDWLFCFRSQLYLTSKFNQVPAVFCQSQYRSQSFNHKTWKREFVETRNHVCLS